MPEPGTPVTTSGIDLASYPGRSPRRQGALGERAEGRPRHRAAGRADRRHRPAGLPHRPDLGAPGVIPPSPVMVAIRTSLVFCPRPHLPARRVVAGRAVRRAGRPHPAGRRLRRHRRRSGSWRRHRLRGPHRLRHGRQHARLHVVVVPRPRRRSCAERRERLPPAENARVEVSGTGGRPRTQLPRAAEPPGRHLGDVARETVGPGPDTPRARGRRTRWTRSSTRRATAPTSMPARRSSAKGWCTSRRTDQRAAGGTGGGPATASRHVGQTACVKR